MSQNGPETEARDNPGKESARHSFVPTPVIDLMAARSKRKLKKQQTAQAAKGSPATGPRPPSSRFWFLFARAAQITIIALGILYILRTCGRI